MSEQHRCEVCGQPVVVVSDKDGTCHYEAAGLDVAEIKARWQSGTLAGLRAEDACEDIADLLDEVTRLQHLEGELERYKKDCTLLADERVVLNRRITQLAEEKDTIWNERVDALVEHDTLKQQLEEAHKEKLDAYYSWQAAYATVEEVEAKLLRVEGERDKEAEAAAIWQRQRNEAIEERDALLSQVAALRGEKE